MAQPYGPAPQSPESKELQKEWHAAAAALRHGNWGGTLFESIHNSLEAQEEAQFRTHGAIALATCVSQLLRCSRYKAIPTHRDINPEHLTAEEREAIHRAIGFLRWGMSKLYQGPASFTAEPVVARALEELLTGVTSHGLYDTYLKLPEREYLPEIGHDLVRVCTSLSDVQNEVWWNCPIQTAVILEWTDCHGLDHTCEVLTSFDEQGKLRNPLPLVVTMTGHALDVIKRFGPTSFSPRAFQVFRALDTFLDKVKDDELKPHDKVVLDRLFAAQWASLRENIIALLNGKDDAVAQELLSFSTRLRLKYVGRLLKVPSISLRLAGLTDLLEVHKRATARELKPKEPEDDQKRLRQALLDWIINNRTIDYLYQESNHPDLLRRLGPLLALLATGERLDKAMLDKIWSYSEVRGRSVHLIGQGQHETIVHAMWAGFADMCPSLPYPLLCHFFTRVAAVPPGMYTEHYVTLLKAVIDAGLVSAPPQQLLEFQGLQHLYTLATTANPAITPAMQARFVDLLGQTLSMASSRPLRYLYLENLLKLLDDEHPWPHTFTLLRQTIDSYQLDEGGSAKVIAYLVTTHELLGRLLTLLERQPAGRPELFQAILDFISFLLSSSDIKITEEQLDQLWNGAVLDAKSEENRDFGFRFFETARGIVGYREPLTIPQLQYIFDKKLPTIDLRILSGKGFLLFDFYFRYLNWHFKKFEQVGEEFTILANDLLGMELLWRIALTVRNPKVGDMAVRFVTRLQKNFAPKLQDTVKQQREQFFARVLTAVEQASGVLAKERTAEAEAGALLQLERALDIISLSLEMLEDSSRRSKPSHNKAATQYGKAMKLKLRLGLTQPVPEAELDVYDSQTIDEVKELIGIKWPPFRGSRLIGSRVSDDLRLTEGMMVQLLPRAATIATVADEVEASDISPSHILSTQATFELFFQQLGLPRPLGLRFWELIERLPTSTSHRKALQELADGSVLALLDETNVFKLFYALQIVNSILPEDSAGTWRTRFFAIGGPQHLIRLLVRPEDASQQGFEKWPECRSLVFSVLSSLLVSKTTPHVAPQLVPDLQEPIVASLAGALDRLFGLLAQVERDTESRPSSARQAEETSFTLAMRLVVALLLAGKPAPSEHHLTTVLGWLDAFLLRSSSARIREMTSRALFWFAARDGGFFQRLLNDLGRVISTVLDPKNLSFMAVNADEYWRLFQELLTHDDAGNPGLCQALVPILGTALEQHPVVEATTEATPDALLAGILRLLITVLQRAPQLPREMVEKLLVIVVRDCLFQTPRLENAEANVPFPPKCKTPALRAAAFQTVEALLTKEPAMLGPFAQELLGILDSLDWKSTWQFKPDVSDRDPSLFAGLKNLGATCYMNSLLQQLFMLPQLRSGLLEAPVPATIDPTQSILCQVQSLFATLQETSKRWHDAKGLASIYKVDGQPIRVAEQMDADEFFRGLLDKLETDLKSLPQAKILDRFFRGAITYQTISKECEHTSERDETYYNLAVEVKDKTTLTESLQALVAADTLDGDNKWHCERCNKKVAALRRATLGELPPVLVVHLKRFEFDLETMRRTKINTTLEFPEDLDVEPYTKEGLSRRDRGDQAQREPCLYRLSGVVVHTGSVDSGHYYSFIRDPRGTNWFQFNDRHVSPWSPTQLNDECFGGVMHSYYDHIRRVTVSRTVYKPNNAYMLFYKRVGSPILAPTKQLRSFVPPQLLSEIWSNNERFARERLVFDKECLLFLQRLAERLPFFANKLGLAYVVGPFRAVITAVFKVVAHAAEHPPLADMLQPLQPLLQSAPIANQLLEVFAATDGAPLQRLLISCPDPLLVQVTIDMLAAAASTVVAVAEGAQALADAPPLPIVVGPTNADGAAAAAPAPAPVVEAPHGPPLLRLLARLHYILSEMKDDPFAGPLELIKRLLVSSPPVAAFWIRSSGLQLLLEMLMVEPEKKKKDDTARAKALGLLVECIALLARAPLPPKDVDSLYQDQVLYHILRNDAANHVVIEFAVNAAATPQLASRIVGAINYGLNRDNAEAFKPYINVMVQLVQARPEVTRPLLDGFFAVVERNRAYPVATNAALTFLNKAAPFPHVAAELIALRGTWLHYLLYRSQGHGERVRYTIEALVQQLTRLPAPRHVPFKEGGREFGNAEQAPLEQLLPPKVWLAELYALLPAMDRTRLDALLTVEERKERIEAHEAPWTLRSMWRLLHWLLDGATEEDAAPLLQPDRIALLCDLAAQPCMDSDEPDFGHPALLQLLERLADFPQGRACLIANAQTLFKFDWLAAASNSGSHYALSDSEWRHYRATVFIPLVRILTVVVTDAATAKEFLEQRRFMPLFLSRDFPRFFGHQNVQVGMEAFFKFIQAMLRLAPDASPHAVKELLSPRNSPTDEAASTHFLRVLEVLLAACPKAAEVVCELHGLLLLHRLAGPIAHTPQQPLFLSVLKQTAEFIPRDELEQDELYWPELKDFVPHIKTATEAEHWVYCADYFLRWPGSVPPVAMSLLPSPLEALKNAYQSPVWATLKSVAGLSGLSMPATMVATLPPVLPFINMLSKIVPEERPAARHVAYLLGLAAAGQGEPVASSALPALLDWLKDPAGGDDAHDLAFLLAANVVNPDPAAAAALLAHRPHLHVDALRTLVFRTLEVALAGPSVPLARTVTTLLADAPERELLSRIKADS